MHLLLDEPPVEHKAIDDDGEVQHDQEADTP
jgi:hypothetical protein